LLVSNQYFTILSKTRVPVTNYGINRGGTSCFGIQQIWNIFLCSRKSSFL